MELISDQAFILRTKTFGENDLLVTYFSLENGLYTSLIKNGKKSEKGLSGQLLLFSEITLYRNLPKTKNALTKIIYTENSKSYNFTTLNSLAIASFCSEILLKILEEQHPIKPLYYLLKDTFALLETKTSPENFSLIFIVKILDILGFLPDFSHCGICNEKIQKNIQICWQEEGNIICENCFSEQKANLSFNELKILNYWQKYPFTNGTNISLTNAELKSLEFFLHQELKKHLKSQLKSLDTLRDLGLLKI